MCQENIVDFCSLAIYNPFRASLLKAYNKTLEEGFFPMIVVDAPNTKVHTVYMYIYIHKCKKQQFSSQFFGIKILDSIGKKYES